jgi:hypothetical protein
MRTMKPSTMNPKHPGQTGFANVRFSPAPHAQSSQSRYPLYPVVGRRYRGPFDWTPSRLF